MAAWARLIFAAPDGEEIAKFLVQGRFATRDLIDGFLENFGYGQEQALALHFGELADARFRMQLGVPTDFVGIGISEAVDGAMVEKEGFELISAFLHEGVERGPVPLWSEGVEANPAPTWEIYARGPKIHLAHLLVVAVPEFAAVLQEKGDREIERLPIALLGETKPPGEHGVDANRLISELKPDKGAVALDGLNRTTGDPLFRSFGEQASKNDGFG